MSWIIIALCSAAVSGMVNILDKTVLFRFVRGPLTLPLLIGLAQGTLGIILTLTFSWPSASSLAPHAWALLSGALWGTGALLMFRALFSQEVSRVIPVYQTFPIFAAFMAALFLDERLAPLQWAAVVVTVAGAVLLSVQRDEIHRRLFLHRSFLIVMLGSVVAASAFIVGSIALEELPVINTHALRNLGLSGVLLAVSLRPAPWREVRELLRRRSPALALVGVNEFLLANAGFLLALWALSLGPVTLVTTLVATRSLFLVLYSTLLTMRFRGLLGERMTAATVTVKFAAVTLILGGVAGISLS